MFKANILTFYLIVIQLIFNCNAIVNITNLNNEVTSDELYNSTMESVENQQSQEQYSTIDYVVTMPNISYTDHEEYAESVVNILRKALDIDALTNLLNSQSPNSAEETNTIGESLPPPAKESRRQHRFYTLDFAKLTLVFSPFKIDDTPETETRFSSNEVDSENVTDNESITEGTTDNQFGQETDSSTIENLDVTVTDSDYSDENDTSTTESTQLEESKKQAYGRQYRTNYCQLCDVPGTHTVCQNPYCTLQGNCTKIPQKLLNKHEKRLILDYHNELRNRIALGQVENQPYYATNMNELIWDDELESIAQCWANQCVFEHDRCRDTQFDYVGQNIVYHSSTSYEYIINDNLTRFVDDWFNEYKDLPGEFVKSLPVENPTFTLHYTQLVWAQTTRLGCARVLSFDDPFVAVYLYCNYAPGGNIITAPVYKVGAVPASECEFGRKQSSRYSGLCM